MHAIACERIFGLECWKNCRNFGIIMFNGRLSSLLSSTSAESSQIFCNAPNAPSHMLYSGESSMSQSVGRSWGQLRIPPLLAMLVMRMPTVALISGDGSPSANRHSLLMYSSMSGWRFVACRMLFFRIRPLSERVGSSCVVNFVST